MTAGLQPYSDYKDSGLLWLGRVPKHWQLERAKWLYRQMARPVQAADGVVTCFRDGMVTLRNNRRTLGFTNSLKEIGYQGIRKGDLVIHAMDAFAGAVGVSDSDGKCTPVYAVCTPKADLDNRYYAYVVRVMARSQWILALARGIRERSTDFRFEGFANQAVPWPCIDEQKAIANYLDANAVVVHRFIRNRRRLIEVLNEQKQAIINRAVTRGLNPNAPLTPSGIDWLGDVPEHWEVKAVWQVFKIGRGKVTSNQYVGGHPGPYPLYSSQTENDGVMGSIDTYMFDGEYLTWTTDGAHAGTVFHRRGRFNCTNVCGTLKANNPQQIYLPFMRWALASVTKRQVRLDINPKLMNNMMARIRMCVPPYAEQVMIGESFEGLVAKNDAAITRLKREIDLIREYRTRLIADVVTGKLDVRGLAPAEIPADELTEEPADGIDGGEAQEDETAELVEEAADADD